MQDKNLPKTGTVGDLARPTGIPIEVLELSVRCFNSLKRGGYDCVEQLLPMNDLQLLSLRNLGTKALEELHQALAEFRYRAEQQPEARSARSSAENNARLLQLAEIHRILILPAEWSWVALLNMGYNWDQVQAFDVALRVESLAPLISLPTNSLVGVDTICYLLRMGCPLHEIPARRLTINQSNRRSLDLAGLTTFLQILLADRACLQVMLLHGDFEAFVTDVQMYIEWLSSQSEWANEIKGVGPSPVALYQLTKQVRKGLITNFLGCLDGRKREVLVWRYGLEDDPPRTLQEIALKFGITRERVRQIEQKALKQLAAELNKNEVMQAFIWLCRQIVDHAQVIVSDSLAEQLAGQIGSGDSIPVPHICFLAESLAKQVYYLEPLDLFVSLDLAVPKVEELLRIIRQVLAKAKAPMRIADLWNAVQLDNNTDELPKEEILVICLQANPEFMNVGDDYWGLTRWEKNIVDDLVMVLRDLDHPAHFRELTKLVNQRLPEDQQRSERAIHGTVDRLPDIFIRTGPGTFALREQYPDLPDQPAKYVDLIKQVLQQADHPLPIEDIFRLVNEQREAKKSSILMYLTLDPRFRRFNSNLFGLSSWKHIEPADVTPEPNSLHEPMDDFVDELKRRVLQGLQSNMGN
jgi:DNA-directed RNA polymerase delta subunit